MNVGHTKGKGSWFTNRTVLSGSKQSNGSSTCFPSSEQSNTRQIYSIKDDKCYQNQSSKLENEILSADKITDDFQKSGRPEKCSDILYTFCDTTSAHGFYQVKLGREWTTKFRWLLVLMIGFSGLGYHLSSLIIKNLKFEYDETTLLVSESPQFPDVTICNMDGISGDRFVL